MAQENTHPNARRVALEGQNGLAFLLIHGYTGSPTDFNGLSHFLHDQMGASVFVPLLPGHGSRVEDLRSLTKDDFVKYAEENLKEILAKHKRVIVGGHSFGGQVALYLAARYPVEGVFVTAVPYRVAFPLSFPGLYKMWKLLFKKEFVKKKFSEREMAVRKRVRAFSYDYMPTYGLKLILDMNADLRECLSKVTSPVLSIYLHGDTIAHSGSGEAIEASVGSTVKKNLIFNALEHGAFFSEHAEDIYKEIAGFFKK